jgi:hypothetical protein
VRAELNETDPIENQPLSPKAYGVIAVVGVVLVIATICLYALGVPRFVQAGMQDRVFYLILILAGLVSAAFLSGVMHSFAHVQHRKLGLLVRLGGPTAVAFLVVVGCYWLVPPPKTLFDLTVRAHSQDGGPLVTSGSVTIEFGASIRTEAFGVNGEANFKGLPSEFKTRALNVLPQVEGYNKVWQRQTQREDTLELSLAPEHPQTFLNGSISPAPTGKKIRMTIEGQDSATDTSPDDLGRFKISVEGRDGEQVRLRVFEGDRLVFDDYETLPGPISIHLREHQN